jgi:hypothetical protein
MRQAARLQVSSTCQLVSPAAAAFTAFTASTNLCSLRLGLCGASIAQGEHLFRPGGVYPRLHVINLKCTQPQGNPAALPLSSQQLQRLCSCCPVLESLECSLYRQPYPTALLPLLQQSGLTRLGVHSVGATAVLGVAAQLTGLKQLV